MTQPLTPTQFVKRVLVCLTKILTLPLGKKGRQKALRVLREGMGVPAIDETMVDVSIPNGVVRFYCLGDTPLWRARTLLTKEPETIEWIDTMTEADVLYDIGANVGVFTLYGAINRHVRVLAFEPLAANYFLLNRNIEENKLSGAVSAYCLALTDRNLASSLHVKDTGFGSALSSFADPIDYRGETFVAQFEQGMIGLTLDSFIERFDPPFPTHLKIDVDGIEDRIIAGAPATLADPRLKSILIELDSSRPEYTNDIIAEIERHGFHLESRRHSQMVEESTFSDLYNYIFRR